ncbi:MAG: family N-acetyltransferase [Flaviaesturariibacter sp.]|nr:family N-acetyltransferase [Flaviaesturariibacter sp.]
MIHPVCPVARLRHPFPIFATLTSPPVCKNCRMITIKRTDSTHPDFISLVRLLDADLALRDGSEHSFYAAFNKIDTIRHCVVAYRNEIPVGCGAIKLWEPGSLEVKRMYTMPEQRGAGIASAVLGELERWARELGASACVLETGKKQPEAIALYRKNGYAQIPNYGQYAGIENSVCFEKRLDPAPTT